MFFLIFGSVWTLFTMFFWLAILTSATPVSIVSMVIVFGFTLPGMIFIYYSLVMMFDTIFIRATRSSLTVYRRPFPWFKWEMPIADIKQVLVHHEMTERSSMGGTKMIYAIRVHLNNGGSAKLIGGIRSLEQAESIEKNLESYWNIEDQRTDDEVVAVAQRRILDIPAQDPEGAYGGTDKYRMRQLGGSFSGWEVIDPSGRKVGVFVRAKNLGLNRNMLVLAVILGGMGFGILYMILASQGSVGFQVVFVPVVMVAIFVLGVRSMGTLVYRTDKGSYIYSMGRKQGTMNTGQVQCKAEGTDQALLTESGGTITYPDGTKCYISIGCDLREGRRSAGLSPNAYDVSIVIYKDKKGGIFDGPILRVKDNSSVSGREAEIMFNSNILGEEKTHLLIGLVAQTYQWYKLNPNMAGYSRP